jgi:hypothetical protein
MTEVTSSKEKFTIDGILHVPHNHFNGKPLNSVNYVPHINIAYMSNCKDESHKNVTSYHFNPIQMSYADFKNCFYPAPLNHFFINKSNMNTQVLSFQQTYSDTTNQNKLFNIDYALRHAWSEHNQLPIKAIPVQKQIALTKHSGLTRGLGNIRGGAHTNLSFDEAIHSLLQSGDIKVGDIGTCANIAFEITVNYCYSPLEVALELTFVYIVCVPGFINKGETNQVYSKDTTPPRKRFDFKLDDDEVSYEEHDKLSNDKHLEFNDDTSSESSERKKDEPYEYIIDDNITLITDTSNIVSEVSKFIKGGVSVAESKPW